jgi:hypothetical protein
VAIFVTVLVASMAMIAGTVLAVHDPGATGDVGPISSDNGYPVWYRDAHGTEVELCLEFTNAFCGFLPGDIPFENDPISFPGNFPGEAFWWTGDSSIDNGGNKAMLIMAVEAAFASGEVPLEGDQVSFGRVRIRLDGLIANETYTVTHPYGVTTVVAEGDGTVFVTEDIGALTAPAEFALTLNSPVLERLLEWTPVGDEDLLAVLPDLTGPAGVSDGEPDYLGHPDIDHVVTGSPHNTNFFRVEGPPLSVGESFGAAASADYCGGGFEDGTCIQTDLFNVMGKRAVTSGVETLRAAYVKPASGGPDYIEVFAKSRPGQNIEISGFEIGTVTMLGAGDIYYAKLLVGGTPPATVTATNVGDGTSMDAAVTDLITITMAEYNIDDGMLTVEADSTNAAAILSAVPAGVDIGILSSGRLSVPVAGAPLNVTVESDLGGTDTEPVRLVGSDFAPLAVVAVASVDPTDAIPGQMVMLDGTGSAGQIDTYSWEQVGGSIGITDADEALANFTVPLTAVAEVLEFELTVTGSTGTDTTTVMVTVTVGNTPAADAGEPTQLVFVDNIVTLDGTASTFSSEYAWAWVSGPDIVIVNADQPVASFRMPPGGSVVVELTTTGDGGVTDTDTVTIEAEQDGINIVSAELRRRKGMLRIQGSTDIFSVPNEVSFHVPDGDGTREIGTATVDPADGTFDFRLRSGVDLGWTTVDIVSRRGAFDGVDLNVRR